MESIQPGRVLRSGRLKAFSVLLVVAALVTACGETDTTGGTDTSVNSNESGGESTHGGTLVVALGATPQSINIGLTLNHHDNLPASPIMESLVHIERYTGEITPKLAESWEISDDERTYTFHLREGVTWHDGEPFTAADVEFTFAEMLEYHPVAATLVDRISSVEVIDDHTIAVSLSDPYAPFVYQLTKENFGLFPKHVWEGTDVLENPARTHPIGTGPFKFDSFTPGQSVELVRNENYWQPGKPYLDRIVFQEIPDPASQVRSLKAGDIHLIDAYHLDLSQVSTLENDPNIFLDADRNPATEQLMMVFNTSQPPLDDKRVRQALVLATDRQLIVDGPLGGNAMPGTSPMPPKFPWAHDESIDYNEMYPYDPDAAAALLDEAGYTADDSGTRFSLEWLMTDFVSSGAIGDIIKSKWADIGVNVTLVNSERTAFMERYTDRDYQIVHANYTSRNDPAIGVTRSYVCQEEHVTYVNSTYWCDPEVDDLFNAAIETSDLSERGKLYMEAEAIIAEEMPTLPMAYQFQFDAVRTEVGGFEAFNQGGNFEGHWEELALDE